MDWSLQRTKFTIDQSYLEIQFFLTVEKCDATIVRIIRKNSGVNIFNCYSARLLK